MLEEIARIPGEDDWDDVDDEDVDDDDLDDEDLAEFEDPDVEPDEDILKDITGA